MTREQRSKTPMPTRLTRLVGGLTLAGVLSLAGAATFGGATEASPRTSSDVIANEADRAVIALDRWADTLDPADYVRFVKHRDRAAFLTERDIELPDGTLRTEWADVSLPKQHALLSAVSQLGVPYRNLASERDVGFDCSGLTSWAYGTAGLDIPRISRDQIRKSDSVDRADAEAGDLVYYPGHVSMYVGGQAMVHSPNSGNYVEITMLPDKSLEFGDIAAALQGEQMSDSGADPAPSLVDRTDAITK